MQCETIISNTTIRRLGQSDLPDIIDHFLRLDPETRRLRFGVALKDCALRRYAERVVGMDAVVYGAFAGDTLRGVAELRGFLGHWPPTAEAALSVEREWQNAGIGDALFSRLLAAAQNRSIRTLHMVCLRENARMQHLARKHRAVLQFSYGDVEATLGTPWPTLLSLTEEILGETRRFARSVLHLPS
ncbi:GNAT family N-acetyltransferase [Roseovarius pelagicus]|uniref:GNAT family N-acetyltransferase n=1 Tax=Roseovarius pelagicus TaxID=2980108 RepID=A0ABY6D9U7_9RHOB|nr:GNAT family N-acetyltransferase [Roseovarius pelagicus]UXX81838.1 GNAT family N-acetyltransferase [Roseovarius pelagicus]